MRYIGIDGCRSGWFYVGLDENDKYSFRVISDISMIKYEINNAKQVLIDIPIGLQETNTKERLCDLEARKVLGPRRSSVFPPPSRLALSYESYQKASAVNLQNTGRGLSKQSFEIMQKINEVDEFVRNKGSQRIIREMHPEVCFWALNGYEPMMHNKKTPGGILERTLLLNRYYSKTEELLADAKIKYLRKELAIDDIIDALAGSITAKEINNLKTLPIKPEIDNRGLPMEMVYVAID